MPGSPSLRAAGSWLALAARSPEAWHGALISAKALLFPTLGGIGPGYARGWPMSVGLVLLAMAGVSLLPGRLRGPAAALINFLLSFLMFSDLIYLRWFREVLSMAAWGAAGNLDALLDSLRALARPEDLVLFGDLLVLGALRLRRPWPAPPRSRPLRLATAGLLLCAVSGLVHIAGRDAFIVGRTVSSRTFVRSAGVLAFHVHDAVGWARDHLVSTPITDAERAAVAAGYAAAAVRSDPGWTGLAAGSNVILLMVEALQQQAMDRVLAAGPVAPHLRALAAESIVVRPFYHQTAQGRTADAELLSLCGLYPLAQGSVLFRYPALPQRCLPEILRDEAGYTTASYHALRGDFWNRAAAAPGLGIQRFHTRRDYKGRQNIGMGMADGPFLQQTAKKLLDLPEPFLAHVITLSSHHPFALPEEIERLDVSDEPDAYLGAYFQAIHYTDAAIGAFVEALRAGGLLDRSLLVVYGDHDMGRLSNFGALIHQAGAEAADPATRLAWLYEVPLLLRLPDGRPGALGGPAGQVQLPATVLHLLGLRLEGRDFFGGTLFTAPSTVAFRDGGAAGGALGWNPEDGSCFAWADGVAHPAEHCTGIAEAAGRLLHASDLVIRHGLTRDVGDEGDTATP